MAKRRGKRKTRTRRKQGISLLNVAETVALSNVATQTLFNVNAWDFVQGGDRFQGGNEITLMELMSPSQQTGFQTANVGGRMQTRATTSPTFGLIQENLRANWAWGATQMFLIPVGFKFGKQLAGPAIRKVNALLRKAGIASTVKV